MSVYMCVNVCTHVYVCVCTYMCMCVLQYQCVCGMPWGGFLLLIGSEGGVEGCHMAEEPTGHMVQAATCEWPTGQMAGSLGGQVGQLSI